ncbi:MAG: transglycosylase domain-containing protein [Ktedonobacteraceae bacterium]|nr:transglycosylase domain-containing protein [Ktedonobacteraceae bacterium]
MQIEEHPKQSFSQAPLQSNTIESKMQKKVAMPAKLPAHSRAAAAQRLNDVPEKPAPGVYYRAPHLVLPSSWRVKRHLKRKSLRQSSKRYAIVERIGTKWTLLPLAFSFIIAIVVLASVFVAVSSLVNATNQRYQTQVTTLANIIPQDSLKAYDQHGTLIYQMLDQGLQTTVPLSKISPQLAHAEIAIEDQSFWTNPGYDITGIVRAALDDLTHGRVVSGGSTITQQLIKNTIVGDQATITRKLQEIILAPEVTRYYSKQQILSMYLNTTYYGEQAYGADAAAFIYFNLQDTPTATAASQLDLAQSSMLAGIPSSPIAHDPFLHPNTAFQRMQEVLRQMYLQGYITHNQEVAALVEAQGPTFLHRGVIKNDLALHFMSYALNELAHELHVKVSDLSRAGLVVSTTLDLGLQNKVLQIARQHISALAAAHHMSNAAEVMIDYHTGAIRVLLGNLDPNDPNSGQFDVATQGYRQSGSSFKPFIYATAFAKGISPGTPVLDGPFTIQLCCGLPAYTPQNYDLRYHGLISFRYALQNSFNVPAVKLLTQIGVDDSLHTAQSMGITDYVGTPNYTMVLGSLGIHLIDETAAYGVFANGGIRIPPHAIDTVKDVQGHVILQVAPIGTRVISKQVAFMITNVLSDNNSRTFEFGKCSALYLYSSTETACYLGHPGSIRPAAVKTGTSNNFADNWTVGYTTDYVMGVWAGNDDNSPMVNITGVDGAAPIWHDSLLLAEQGQPIKNFPSSVSGVVKKTVSYPGITTTDWYIAES